MLVDCIILLIVVWFIVLAVKVTFKKNKCKSGCRFCSYSDNCSKKNND